MQGMILKYRKREKIPNRWKAELSKSICSNNCNSGNNYVCIYNKKCAKRERRNNKRL